MTHRQFVVWQHWLRDQWNMPDRTDHYLMQIACEVRRANAQHPNQIQLEHFRLKFETAEKPKSGGLTQEQIDEVHKQRWLAIITGGGKVPVTEVRK